MTPEELFASAFSSFTSILTSAATAFGASQGTLSLGAGTAFISSSYALSTGSAWRVLFLDRFRSRSFS